MFEAQSPPAATPAHRLIAGPGRCTEGRAGAVAARPNESPTTRSTPRRRSALLSATATAPFCASRYALIAYFVSGADQAALRYCRRLRNGDAIGAARKEANEGNCHPRTRHRQPPSEAALHTVFDRADLLESSVLTPTTNATCSHATNRIHPSRIAARVCQIASKTATTPKAIAAPTIQ